MRRLLLAALLLLALGPTPAPAQAGAHYAVRYVLTGVDLRRYPLFSVAAVDGNGNPTLTPVYMATETFTTWLGQFTTLGDCQGYVPPAHPSFTFFYTDPMTGLAAAVTFTDGVNMTATNYGCGDRNFN